MRNWVKFLLPLLCATAYAQSDPFGGNYGGQIITLSSTTSSVTDYQGNPPWTFQISSITVPNVTIASNTIVTTDALPYTGIVPSTGTCGDTPTLVVSASTTAVGTRFCNRGQLDVMTGGATITPSVGGIVFAGACVDLDNPRYFRGSLYCISTSTPGFPQLFSTIQAFP
jgi:hypothetical protein